jgi:formylglycine-generating enzyme required for sulfatase activity
MKTAWCFISLLCLLVGLSAQDRGLAVIARQAAGSPNFDIGKQYAVIIGIDQYQNWNPLKAAVGEAREFKRVLAENYYIDEFIELYDQDATAANLRRLFSQTLPAKLGVHDSLLLFYAGHGYLDSASNTGYWIPVDGGTDTANQDRWFANSQLRGYLSELHAQRILVLADSCFSGDLLDTRRGPAPVVDAAYYRTALQYSARQVLSSGASQTVPDQSEFGRELVGYLERNSEPLVDALSIYEHIRKGITQTLPLFGALPGNEAGASFVLFRKPAAQSAQAAPNAEMAPAATPTITVSRSYGSIIVSAATAGALFLDGKSIVDLPAGAKAKLDPVEVGDRSLELRYADGQVESRSAAVEEGQAAIVSFTYRKAAPRAAAGAVPLGFVLVQGGTFTMGSPESEAGRLDNEVQHRVTLSSFAIARTDVTVGEYKAFVNATKYKTGAEAEGTGGYASAGGQYVWRQDADWRNPYFAQTDEHPVVVISWYDAIAYCNWKSLLEGKRPAYSYNGEVDFSKWPAGWNIWKAKTDIACDFSASGYRLPTEAEWEYAAKGGPGSSLPATDAVYAGSAAIDDIAWYAGNAGKTTHPVAQKAPNALGLFDMAGDVWQWCQDWYGDYSSTEQTDPRGPDSGGSRVIRGGSWFDIAKFLRSSYRDHDIGPGYRGPNVGFRLVCSMEGASGAARAPIDQNARSADSLGVSDRLLADQKLVSPNREYTLIMQRDGNLVLYFNPTRHATWASNTYGRTKTPCLIMQEDGNLVIYDNPDDTTPDHALWASNTYGRSGDPCLKMQDDGNAVVYKSPEDTSPSNAIWASNTYRQK